MNCARLAEKAVALVCCEKLHKIGKKHKRFDVVACFTLSKLGKGVNSFVI